MTKMRTLTATRYLTPLREGGSLPAVVEADDGELYVMKFLGAGQGAEALIAELVSGEIARVLGLRVPEIVFLILEPAFGQSEPNAEIRGLLRASVGLNLGLRYLPQAFTFNPMLPPPLDGVLASAIVWLDAYVMNVDRTLRNINLLDWQHELWLIDHGATLYFHHNWASASSASRSAFPLIKDHALLPLADRLADADAGAKMVLTAEVIAGIVDLIPDIWLRGRTVPFADPAEHRRAYAEFLLNRLAASTLFVAEANRVRAERI
jgi:hypothetical protein